MTIVAAASGPGGIGGAPLPVNGTGKGTELACENLFHASVGASRVRVYLLPADGCSARGAKICYKTSGYCIRPEKWQATGETHASGVRVHPSGLGRDQRPALPELAGEPATRRQRILQALMQLIAKSCRTACRRD